MFLNMCGFFILLLAQAFAAAAGNCGPVVVTETVFVTKTCMAGDCPPPGSTFNTVILSSTPTASIVPPPPPPPPPPPQVTSSPSSDAKSNPSSASQAAPPSPPSAHNTAEPSLLCGSPAADAVVAPMPFGADRIAEVAVYNALPTLAATLCQAPSHFHQLTTTPNSGSIKNSCKYDVYVESVGCGSQPQGKLIAAGSTWTEPLRSCDGEGIVYKVSSSSDMSKPIQFELGMGTGNSVFYDISFLDCMVPNTTDLSACPGWEGGVQCIAGGKGCPVYVCGPGEYCDGSSYTVPEFGLIKDGPHANQEWRAKAGAPNTACDTKEEGIAFEICAAN